MHLEKRAEPDTAATENNLTLSGSRLGRRLARVPPLVWVLALTFVCLAVFIGKAIHIDDTLFLRAAEQIQKHPFDFYGFSMNWFGSTKPMIENFDNPPLACYYIALVTGICGWSEPALHLAFMLPALAAAWGIFSLARSFCTHPLLAALVAVLTPVFIISGTTLMCDMMLLAFWVWAIVLFEKGLVKTHLPSFVASGVLIGLAFWTKFLGLALVPLLAAYGVCVHRRVGWWVVTALLPLTFVMAYEWITFRLYGKGLLLAAAGYASSVPQSVRGNFLEQQVRGLEFIGGCFLPILFYAPWLWPRRSLLKSSWLLGPCLLAPLLMGTHRRLVWGTNGQLDWAILLQSAVFLAAGLHFFVLAVSDVWSHRDATSLLLLLWVLGLFVFATTLNWTINGRSLLPMVPAVGMLVARRFERQQMPCDKTLEKWRLLWPGLAAATFSLLLAKADYDLANTGRAAAAKLCAKYPPARQTIWFQGHWGFQYYMEKAGKKALDRSVSVPMPGDLVIVASESPSVFDFSVDLVRLVETLEYTPNVRYSTMNLAAGAGFYAALDNPFPFSIGYIDPERYYVFKVTQTLASAAKRSGGLSQKGAVAHEFELERQAAIWQKALRANPHNTDAHLQVGRFLVLRAKDDEAEKHFAEVLRLVPDHLDAHLELALLCNRQHRPAEAIRHYQTISRLKPDFVRALDDLAWLLATCQEAQLRNGAEAVRLAERANELTGHSSPAVLTTLAAAYAEQGLFAQAVATSQKASELALKNNQQELLSQNEALLHLYQANRPFHQ